MSEKGRNIAMSIAGSYLICTGGLLVAQTMESHPSSENIFITSGVIFALFGVYVVSTHLLRLWKSRPKKDTTVERIEFEVEPVERSVEPKVQMIKLEVQDSEEFLDEDEMEELEEEVVEDEVIEDEEYDEEDWEDLEEEYDEAEDEFEIKLEKV